MTAQKTLNVTLWIAADKVHQLFGSVSNSTITYESGASIWIPAQAEQHMLRGMKYTATGSPQQLQQLAAKLLNQAALSAAFTTDQDAKEWWYLNDEDVQFGPFSGKQLSKYNSSGVWTPDFLICHGPAGIWLPIWLVLRLLGLQAQLKRSLPASVPAAGQTSSAKPSTAAGAGRAAAAATLGAADCDDDYGAPNAVFTAQDRGLITRYHTTTRPHQQRQQYSGAAAGASYGPYGQTRSRSNTMDSFGAAAAAAGSGASPAAAASGQPSSDMLMVQEPGLESDPQGVLAEVARLRQDSAYLEELNRAVDMDWEPLQQQQQQWQQGQWGAEQSAGIVKGPGSHALADMADLPATQLAVASIPAAASMLQQQQQQLTLVVDTNVLLDDRGLQLLQQLQDMQQGGLCGGVQLVVLLAWTVLVELDKLKTRSGPVCHGVSVAAQARAAVRYLQEAMAANSCTRHMFKAQSVQEFRVAAREFDFGVADSSLVADDRILQCALHVKNQQQQCVGGVLLLTGDRVLRLKAQANAIAAASLKELPIVSAEQQQQQQQSLLTSLMQLAQAGTDFHSRSDKLSCSSAPSKQQQQQVPAEVSARSTAGATVGGSGISQYAAAATAVQSTAVQSTAAVGSWAERPHAAVAASALRCITQLRLGLSDRVVEIFKQEFDNLWLDVVSSKPPWKDIDFLYVLKKHWRSCLLEHCTPSARNNSKQLEAAIQYLIDTHKQLQKHNYSQLQMPQVNQNVAVRVMQLLEAFGAAAVAAEVAAAAGLDISHNAAAAGAGGLSGLGRGLSDPSDAGVQLHSSSNLGNAAGSAQRPGLHIQSGKHTGMTTGISTPRGSNSGGRSAVEKVAETGARLGSNLTGQQYQEPVLQRVKKHAMRHATQQQQQQQQQQQEAAVEVQRDASWQLPQGSEQASSKRQRGATGHASAAVQQQQQLGSSSSVRQLDMQHVQLAVQLQQDYQNQQQQQLVNSSSVGQQVPPDMQHVAHTQLPVQLQQDHHHQQQQQQCGQQSLHAENTQQQQQQRYPGTAAMLAAAAAAGVPAPALHGPCLRMQQLLQYLLAVLGAFMQPLHQALQYAPAADEVAQMTTAVGQKMQHIVQMLDWILTQLHQLYQQQQPRDVLEAAAASGVGLQEHVLQAGLSLVELCALLVNQPQAGCAVAAQLSANAVHFAHDALAYLWQGCSVPAGQGQGSEVCFHLQQLRAAEQQLGWLAAQAAELSARGNSL